MKKMILLAMVVIMTFAGNAQRRNVQLGIKAGVNISNYNDAVATTGTNTGFHAGLLAHIHLAPSWALQPEVVYSTQGAKFTS